ncbi:aromatic ring-hydroxylating dioxygenase subunit alpha [Paraburkholderia kururiensis]|uniref:aromatic ring-hydroxylating dioxygenase subunit alpha n=1 Tax=Paraburkholderia kururiensis TaxID=984307 RepID=UPI000F8902C1|nr:aromatic ring-hydroxylating dioxygenase subunit alpha [Paraburkholderia kururiensis]
MPFLRNAWYVAAFSSEVKPDAPLARTLLDQPIVFFRDSAGAPVALDDRCPHRFAPLSRGRCVDGAIECPYHGLRFGAAGECTHNPHGDGRVPAGAKVRGYPLLERYGAVWIWPGDPARAEASALPDFGFLDPAHRYTSEGYLRTQAHYQLSVDNLLDLSHFQFLHPGTLGSDAMARGNVQFASDDETVWVRREAHREIVQPFMARSFGVAEGASVDRWFDVRWNAPGLLAIAVGLNETGAPPENARVSPSAHWLTPETTTTTHYFFSFGLPREMGEAGQAIVDQAIEGIMEPFRNEDLPMLEAQQRAIGDRDFWSMQPAMLTIDKGAVRARRIMEAKLAREAAGGEGAAGATDAGASLAGQRPAAQGAPRQPAPQAAPQLASQPVPQPVPQPDLPANHATSQGPNDPAHSDDPAAAFWKMLNLA